MSWRWRNSRLPMIRTATPPRRPKRVGDFQAAPRARPARAARPSRRRTPLASCRAAGPGSPYGAADCQPYSKSSSIRSAGARPSSRRCVSRHPPRFRRRIVLVGDVQPARERDLPVHHEIFPVVAPVHRPARARDHQRVIHRDGDSGLDQRLHEAVGQPERADVVVEQPDVRRRGRRRRERVAEARAGARPRGSCTSPGPPSAAPPRSPRASPGTPRRRPRAAGRARRARTPAARARNGPAPSAGAGGGASRPGSSSGGGASFLRPRISRRLRRRARHVQTAITASGYEIAAAISPVTRYPSASGPRKLQARMAQQRAQSLQRRPGRAPVPTPVRSGVDAGAIPLACAGQSQTPIRNCA